MITDKELIRMINNHEVLHDFITHLSDFKEAVNFLNSYCMEDSDDQKYWDKQYNTIVKLENFIKANS